MTINQILVSACASMLYQFTAYLQRPCRPEIIDFSYIHEFINWNSPLCSNSPPISQYQILTKNNVGGYIEMNFTNETAFEFNCPFFCHFIIKALFQDNSESLFSTCLDVSGQLQEMKGACRHILIIIC